MRSNFRDPSRRQGAFRLFARLLASALLTLLGAGYALPGLHYAAVAHEICAEHGELHHAEGAASLGQTGQTPSEPLRTPALSGSSSEVEHAHEHCSVGTSSAPSSVILRDVTAPIDASTPELRPPTVGASAAKRNLDVLSYAPKLAPPV